MSLSKETANRSDSSSPPDQGGAGRGRRRAWWIAAAGVLAAAAAVVLIRQALDPEPLLAEARGILVSQAAAAEGGPSSRAVGRAEQALEDYLRRTGRAGSSARLLLAICHWYSGRPADAAGELTRVSLEECEPQELLSAALAAFHTGDFPPANRLIDAALARDDLPRERTLRAAILIEFDSGRREQVLDHCRELAALAPDDPRLWMVTASVYEGRGDWPSVVESYRQVLSRTEGEKLLERQVMVGFLLNAGLTEEARREFDSLRKDAPEFVEQDPLLEAKLLYREGMGAKALPAVARALARKPDDAEAMFLRGRIEFERGALDPAIKALGRTVEVEPLNHEARYVLSQALYRAGRREDGDRMLKTYRNLEQAKQRLYALEQQANGDPNNTPAREELVSIYDQLGAKAKADYWRKALGRPTVEQEPQP